MKELIKRIVVDINICHGKPTIRGLRYPVENILQLLSSGMSIEEILEDYEDLEREDILACLSYAVKIIEIKSTHVLDAQLPKKLSEFLNWKGYDSIHTNVRLIEVTRSKTIVKINKNNGI